jgi:predicted outer membrane protein
MKDNLKLGRRVFQNSLVIATTFVTCTALQAEDQSDKPTAAGGGPQSSSQSSSSRQGGEQQVEKFVQKAMASGQMEVRMAQLGQQQAQNPQVKALADAMVRDHTKQTKSCSRSRPPKTLLKIRKAITRSISSIYRSCRVNRR